MNNRRLITILIVTVIIAGILGYLFSTMTIPLATLPYYPIERLTPDTIAGFTILKTMISFINMALILLTLAIYINIYRSIKSRFTAGLVMMILLLLMNALTSNPLLQIRFGYAAVGLGPFAIIPDFFTTIALLILFYLSLE